MANGLFAQYGLDVEFVNAPPGRDLSLSGLSLRVPALAAGAAEFGVSTVPYLMAAQAEAGGTLPVRFISVFHQRHPVSAVVGEDSPLRSPSDLAGRRTAAHTLPWFVAEYEYALAATGMGPAEFVQTEGRDYGAGLLATGEVDVVPTWADTLPVVRRTAGFAVRAIPLGIGAYASGVIAADRVPTDVASRMRDALAAALELQRQQPELGVQAYRARFPQIPVDDIRLSWSSFVRHGWGDHPAGSMEEGTWDRTVAITAAAHSLPRAAPESLYRRDLLPDVLAGVAAAALTDVP